MRLFKNLHQSIYFLFLFLGIILFPACQEKETPPNPNPMEVEKCTLPLPDHAANYPDPYEALGKGDWSFKGPYDWGSRVISIAMDPNNKYKLWAGSASGGLWVNENTQQSAWKYVKCGDFPVMGVGAIAIHPENSDIIYIGTGEVYNYEKSSGGYDLHKTRGSYGIGILYSKDGGKSWAKMSGLPNKNTLGVQDLEFVQTPDGYTLWAATTEGVYNSLNGETLNQKLQEIMATDISVNPNNHAEVIAAIGNLNTPNAGIYRTEDYGNSWKKSVPIPRPPSEFMGKAELARSPQDPNIIYTVIGTWNPLYFYDNTPEKGAGNCYWPESSPKTAKNWIYKSIDGGKTWVSQFFGEKFSGGQGHYSLAITVNPLNTDHLWLGGIAPVRNSYDGGKNVTGYTNSPIKLGGSGLNNQCLWEAMGGFDVHQIIFEPKDSNLIYICSDQGVYMSEDGGHSVKRINQNLAIMQFYPRMAYAKKDSTIVFGSAQDYGPGNLSYMGYNEEIKRSQWKLLYGYGHEAGSCVYDEENNIGYFTIHLGTKIARNYIIDTAMIDLPDTSSKTGGNGALHFIPDLSPFPNRDHLCYKSASWQAPIAFSENNPDILYAAKDILYKSEKGSGKAAGRYWTRVDETGAGLDGNPIHQMHVSSKSENVLFIATAPRYITEEPNKYMHIYHSTTGGKSWIDITGDNLPKGRVPTSLTLDESDGKTIYLTIDGFGDGRVWKGEQNDSGWTWTQIDNDLPNNFTRGFALDPSNKGHLFVATDLGVYKSEDNGNNWAKFSNGLPAAIEGVQLIILDKYRKLRLISHGNGMWEREI